MLLSLCHQLEQELGIRCEFMNMGGGVGIPYTPDDKPFDIVALGVEVAEILAVFENRHGYVPKLFMEISGYIQKRWCWAILLLNIL